MKKTNNQQYYTNKLTSIELLESKNYHNLEENQKNYAHRISFYQEQKDNIGTKIRMLEVYQGLWEGLETQMGGQAFLNEEIWNNIVFNILKYNKFIQELDELDYNKKAKDILDKKTNKELWDQRQQAFIFIRNDINSLNTNFNKMHSEVHKRALLQRKCIEKHINILEDKYKEAEAEKESYRSIFHEVQKDIGAKGNKISKQALADYKISILEKAEYVNIQADLMELDLAW